MANFESDTSWRLKTLKLRPNYLT